MKHFFRIGVWIILAIMLVVIGFMVYTTLVKYKPKKISVLDIRTPMLKNNAETGDVFNILTWNIGYAGLGKEMDFFYEGGKMVRPSSGLCQRYLYDILHEIKDADSADFIFLQEVDQYAKRTYYKDQVNAVQNELNNYYSVFAVNYDVPFVPVPLREPMGRVKAGQMTLSKMAPDSAFRYALEGSYGWPKRLFLLDRCFILTQFKFPSGRMLSLINVHNSAFSDAASARQKELILLKNLMVELYRQGHYVIVGGDWNQNPPGFDPNLFVDGNKGYAFEHVPEDFRPDGWKWAMDKSKATNRNVNEPFEKGKTLTTMIDYFMVSPNVSVLSVKTNPNGFVNSDHQPVALKVRLK
jgi:endonuclease/exonuclease/phosphatase family metal-dependent hydrolase